MARLHERRVTTDRIPYDLAELIARNPDQYVFNHGTNTITPKTGAWATGEDVTLGDGSTATLDGTHWVAATAAPAGQVYVGATR